MGGKRSFGVASLGVLGLMAASSGRAQPSAGPRPVPFDVTAKLQLSGGAGCPCVTVRFTNLGPERSEPFTYQVVQYKWISEEQRYETGVPLNSLHEGVVPMLQRAGSTQKTYTLRLDSGTTYLLKLEYTPALKDSDGANHNIELRYAFP